MLNIYACCPEKSRGRLVKEKPDWHRSPFHRDRDRVIHSASFRRLQYKTQVFANNKGDHFRTRLTHSLEVAQIARSISKILGLCEELSETIALAHDIGHAPFGHPGEDALNLSMKEFGGFDHNAQTLKLLTVLEIRYAKFDGLNLCWETLEGITKHNGPLLGPYATGKYKKIPEFISDFSNKYDLELNQFSSLEAQVASLSDDIAYNNHDLEDAVRSGLVKIEDLEKTEILGDIVFEIKNKYPDIDEQRILHEIIRRSVRTMIYDLLEQTQQNIKTFDITSIEKVRNAPIPIVALSPDSISLQKAINSVLTKKLFCDENLHKMRNQARRVIKDLFDVYFDDIKCLPKDWRAQITKDSSKKEIAIVVCDYIAGMTDRFALTEHQIFFNSLNND